MPSSKYALTSSDVFADPYPTYRQMVAEDPVFFSEEAGGWLVSRYADVVKAGRHPDLSARRLDPWFAALAEHDRTRLEPLEEAMSLWSLLCDPPQHTRLRRLVNQALNPEFIQSLKPRMATRAAELQQQVRARGEGELIHDLALPLTEFCVRELFSLSPAQGDDFVRWADTLATFFGAGAMTIELMDRTLADVQSMVGVLQQTIEDKQARPDDSLISRLTTARAGDDQLSPPELVASLVMLIFAVYGTIPIAIGNGAYCLLRFPDQADRLRQAPSLMTSAINEILRYETPLPRTARMSTAPLELGGVEIPANERVLLMLSAANRDPERFVDPDRFDVGRTPNNHLAFGVGAHYCQGSSLTHVMTAASLSALLEVYPSLRWREGAERWHQNLAIRSLRALPVDWTAR